ncbi:MAG: PDZ domain-containing protein [Deltaproteobacteria bacterium]
MSRQTAGQRWCSLVLLAVFLSLFMYYGLPAMAFRIGRSMEAGRRDAAEEMPEAPAAQPGRDGQAAPFVRASRNVRPAVVSIGALLPLDVAPSGAAADSSNGARAARTSRGCGVVIDPRGFVLTSRRVVFGATQVHLGLSGHAAPFLAKIAGSDAATDLAVLQFEPPAEGVSAVELPEDGNVAIGDSVVAIGNAYHPGEFLWVGTVNSCGRQVSAACCDSHDCIQSAAVNQWNCGAPLVSLQGTIVGINTSFRAAEGLPCGLAVPAGTARQVAAELRNQGRVTRGWLGVFIHKMHPTLEVLRSVGLPEGALAVTVDYVVPGSPAEAGRIRAGDVLLKFAGLPVFTVADLRKRIARTAPNAELSVTLCREGAIVDQKIVIGRQPAIPPQLPGEKEWGVRLLSHLLAEELGTAVGEIPDAVVVQEVEARSRARGLSPRDVILSVNGVPTPTLEVFCREVSRLRAERAMRAVQLDVSSQGSPPRRIALGGEQHP